MKIEKKIPYRGFLLKNPYRGFLEGWCLVHRFFIIIQQIGISFAILDVKTYLALLRTSWRHPPRESRTDSHFYSFWTAPWDQLRCITVQLLGYGESSTWAVVPQGWALALAFVLAIRASFCAHTRHIFPSYERRIACPRPNRNVLLCASSTCLGLMKDFSQEVGYHYVRASGRRPASSRFFSQPVYHREWERPSCWPSISWPLAWSCSSSTEKTQVKYPFEGTFWSPRSLHCSYFIFPLTLMKSLNWGII